MSSHFVHVNGIRLHYLDHAGGDPPIVLLPGLTANAHIFDALVTAGLAPTSRALVPDLRGRGHSDAPAAGFDPARPEANYTIDEHAADVLGWLDEIRVQRAFLAGHSFGGMVALELATRAPERFLKVVLIDWAASVATPATIAVLAPIIERLDQTFPGWEAFRDTLRQSPLYAAGWGADIESYFRSDTETLPDGQVRPRARAAAIRAAMAGTLAVDWPAVLTTVRQPVLLLNAEEPFGPPGAPPLLTRDAALASVALLSDGRYRAAPGNHVTMVFGPNARAVAGAIRGFLDDPASA